MGWTLAPSPKSAVCVSWKGIEMITRIGQHYLPLVTFNPLFAPGGLIKMTESLVMTRSVHGSTSIETALARLHIGIAYRSLYGDTALRECCSFINLYIVTGSKCLLLIQGRRDGGKTVNPYQAPSLKKAPGAVKAWNFKFYRSNSVLCHRPHSPVSQVQL